MNTPSISVIIPTYKREAECLRAVRSVLLQTFQDFEIIVGDDFGADRTESLLLELDDSRVRYFKNGADGGSACRNRNLCLSRANGKYVTFLDSDDFMLPIRLEKQVQALEADRSVGFVIAGTRVVRVIKGQYFFSHDLMPAAEGDLRDAYLKRRLRCYNTSLMVRREVLAEVGNWDHHMEPYDDAELIYRLMCHSQAARVKDIITIWFDHDGECLTNDIFKRMTGLEAFMLKHRGVLENEPTWWNPRIEELLKWFFLCSNVNGVRQWQRGVEGAVSINTKCLMWCARSNLMFRLMSWTFRRMQGIRSLLGPRARGQMLVELVPRPHRKVIADILKPISLETSNEKEIL